MTTNGEQTGEEVKAGKTGGLDGMDRPHWVGVDLGATKILAKVYSDELKPRGRERKKTKGREGPKAVIGRLIRSVREALEDSRVSPNVLAGIGIGCPGPVDMARGVVLEAVNLSWENVPLAKMVAEEFGCPVEVVNDVDAGVYGEYCFGGAREARTALGVFPGTGIGGGCVYDGEILRGRNISAMEIGHVPATPDGRLCGCGRRGCLETEASRLSIAAEVSAAVYRGETSHLSVEEATDLSNIRSGVLASAIEKGDKVVEEIVRRAADRLGVGIAGAIHLIAPDLILLGGGLAEAMPKLFVDTVTKAAQRHVMPSFKETFVVRVAELGDDAAVLGAAAWARKQALTRGDGVK